MAIAQEVVDRVPAEGEKAAEEEEAEAVPAGAGAEEEEAEAPDMMELIDQAEAAKEDPAALAAVLRAIGQRARQCEGDRETLTDFDGVAQICKALSEPPHQWRGPAMVAFCQAMPDVCKKSSINRGALRDEGAVDAVLEFLRCGTEEGDEAAATAASIALNALCTANDGNKKTAARLHGDFNEDELVKTKANDPRVPLFKDADAPGALELLPDAMRRFPASVMLQTHALSALRCLVSDDDTRQATCMPSAVENRDRMIDEKVFPEVRGLILQALALEDVAGQPLLRLREQAMLVLKELSCREDRIHSLVFGGKLLARVASSLDVGDERVVRACLALIRAFGFADEVKEQLVMESDVVQRCSAAVRHHPGSAAICEQAFGLFANVTMRKPHIAARLAGPDYKIVATADMVLERHRGNPNVSRSIIQTLRNVATQVEAAALEVKESDLFNELRDLVRNHGADDKWHSSVEIAKQFLREFREDGAIRTGAQYNEFY